jgi:hypothetical protein
MGNRNERWMQLALMASAVLLANLADEPRELGKNGLDRCEDKKIKR